MKGANRGIDLSAGPPPLSLPAQYLSVMRSSIRLVRRPADGAVAGASGGRQWEIDALRGVAIVMMVVYHLLWDLQGLGSYKIDVYHGFWHGWQLATASLFIGLSGLSQSLRYQSQVQKGQRDYRPFLWRGLSVFSWALVISIVTYLFDPRFYIQWGILHLIGFSMLVAYPLLRFRWLNLFLGLALLGIAQLVPVLNLNFTWFGWLGLDATPRLAFDFFPVIPWMGLALVGVFVGNLLYAGGAVAGASGGARRFSLPELGGAFPMRGLRLLGQNSLLIYLLHQLVLIATLAALGLISL
jgi:uncharacterized membrane protein